MKRLLATLLLALAFAPALTAKTCASRFPADEAWWQPSSAAALAKAIEPLSSTFAAYIENSASTLSDFRDICVGPAIQQAQIARRHTLFTGNTSYAPKEDTFVNFREQVTQPSELGVKWVITLLAPVERLKPGINFKKKNYRPTAADIEALPDIQLDADRLELMVEPGNVVWSVYKGEQLLGTGSVPIERK